MPREIGEKDQRVIFQSFTESVSSGGEPVKLWPPDGGASLPETWAAVQYLYGRELEAAQKINSEITLNFIVNLRRDLTEGMRVKWKSPVSNVEQYWNIHFLKPTEDLFDMFVMCGKVE